MPNRFSNLIERFFEAVLWKSRLVVLLAVVACAVGAVSLFVLGTREVFETVKEVFRLDAPSHGYAHVLIGIIGAVDLFLIGIVMMIFSFGVYELFVSKLDEAHRQRDLKILDINSLDELKSKVLQVVVVVLIVTFFKVLLTTEFKTPLDILFFAVSIICVSLGVFFLRKVKED